MYQIFQIKYIAILFLSFLITGPLNAQKENNFEVIIEEIGNLESDKDPKCHATASRLEDFMFGTPMDAEVGIRVLSF